MLCGRKGWKKVESRGWAPAGSARNLEPGKQAPKPSQPMGGDALIEVAFDNVGTKRLMLKSAAAHMEKI